MGPEPNYRMQRRLLAGVDGLADRGEVRVLEEGPPVPAQPLDVLVVGLLQPALKTPVHRPVSECFKPIVGIMFVAGCCSSAVKRTPHDQEYEGSNTIRHLVLFLLFPLAPTLSSVSLNRYLKEWQH